MIPLNPKYETRLKNFISAHPEYKSQNLKVPRTGGMLADQGGVKTGGDHQQAASFRLSADGHILIFTTTDGAIPQPVQDLFQAAVVLLDAVTTALVQNNYTLYDYEPLSKILRSSGDIVSEGITDSSFDGSKYSATLDLAVVADVLGSFVGLEGLDAMSAVEKLATNAVGRVGAKISASSSSSSSSKKIGHLLFICQDIDDVPIVSISYYYSSYADTKSFIKTPCSTTSASSVTFTYHQEDFMFVSPDWISKYSPELAKDQAAFDALVAKLAKPIASSPSPSPSMA